MFGTVLAAAVGSTIAITNPILKESKQETINEEAIEDLLDSVHNFQYERLIPIHCHGYKIKIGDTLSQLAEDYDIKMSDIKGIDEEVSKDKILREGVRVEYTYYVPISQIRYATKVVDYNNSIEAIAEQYNTDIGTLKLLNGEHYDIDTICVPNFKSIKEIKEEYEHDIENNNGKKM